MALGADDVQAAGCDDLLMQRLPAITQTGRPCLLVRIGRGVICLGHLDLFFDVAAQYDIGTATGHIGCDRDRFRAAGLGDDFRFARMLFRIEHIVRQLGFVQDARQQFGVFNRGGADQYRLAALVAILDIDQHRLILLLRGLVDLILAILTLIRPVLRNDHSFQSVNLLELIGFGIGCAGHA